MFKTLLFTLLACVSAAYTQFFTAKHVTGTHLLNTGTQGNADGLMLGMSPSGTSFVFDGSGFIEITVPEPITSPFTFGFTGMYLVSDTNFRHIFDFDGLEAVLNKNQLWVGNNQGNSTFCARGFSLTGGYPNWPLGQMRTLMIQIYANGTIGPVLINGTALPDYTPVPMLSHVPECAPVNIRPSIYTNLYVGPRFVGNISSFGYTY